MACNAAALGWATSLLVGGRRRRCRPQSSRLLGEGGIDASLQVDPQIDTTVKLRVIGRQQQLLRIDFETRPPMRFSRPSCRTSNGGWRAATPSSFRLRQGRVGPHRGHDPPGPGADKPVLVDPKGDEYGKYAGATVITPESFRTAAGGWPLVVDEAELAAKAEKLRGELGLEALLVTRSEEGMTLFLDGEVIHQPAQARKYSTFPAPAIP